MRLDLELIYEIDTYFNQGYPEEFDKKVTSFETDNLNAEEQVYYELVQIYISFRNRKIDEAVNRMEQLYTQNSNNDNILIKLLVTNKLLAVYFYLEKFKKGVEIGLKCLSEIGFQQLTSKYEKNEYGTLYANIFKMYMSIGLIAKSVPYSSKAEEIYESLHNYRELSRLYNNLGLTRLDSGKVDEGLVLLEKGLALCDKFTYNKSSRGVFLLNIGETYVIKGDYDQALANFKGVLTINPDQPFALDSIGKLYYKLGDLKNAEEALEHALRLFIIANRIHGIIYAITGLIPIRFALNKDIGDIQEILDKHKVTFDDNPNAYYDIEYCKALMYFYSERLKDKIKAQNIIEEMLEYPKLRFLVKINALLLLMELLLLEIQVNMNDAVLKEIFSIIDELETISKNQKLSILQIDTLIMKSKLKFFQKNFDEAIKHLYDALDMSKNNNINYAKNNIADELERISNERSKINNTNSASKKGNKIEINELIDYVQDVRKLQILNKQEKSIIEE